MPHTTINQPRNKLRKLKKLPYWLLVTLILSCGIGTAGVMTILSHVNSNMSFSVSQPLHINNIAWYGAGELPPDVPDTISSPTVTSPNRQSAAIGDEGSGFSAAAEIATGDQIALQLYIGNRSKQPVFGQLDLAFPKGLSIEVYAPKGSSISKVTRINPGSWVIRIISDTIENDVNFLNIVIAASDISLSFYTILGELTTVTHDDVSFDLQLGGGDTLSTLFNIGDVAPSESGISYTQLENIGDVNGTLDIEFSSITETGGTGDGEYEDGIPNLGDYLEIAAYLDIDQSGDFNAGDIGLGSDNTTYSFPTPLDYSLITGYGDNYYFDLTVLRPYDPDDFVVLWRVSPSAGNNIQGDSCNFSIIFILKQDTS